jgi:hypothetical protein
MSQGQSGNAGHGLVWHCPALFLVPDPDWGIKPTLASGCRTGRAGMATRPRGYTFIPPIGSVCWRPEFLMSMADVLEE